MLGVDNRSAMSEEIETAVKAERDRCAKIAENWLVHFGAVQPEVIDAQTWACDAVRDIAEAIRNPETSH